MLLFVFRPLPVIGITDTAFAAADPAIPIVESNPTADSVPTEAGVLRLPAVYDRQGPIEYFDADFMVVHAHPDDESLDNGTLIARLSSAGMRGGSRFPGSAG